MILGIGNIICQSIIVTSVIIGVILVLVAIHCGAAYISGDNRRDTERLRDELRDMDCYGISRHNVFYRFFFRND